MKILLLHNVLFEGLDSIKDKLQNYYISQDKKFESKTFEIFFLKTTGTKLDDNFYLWLNNSIIKLNDYSFENVDIPKDFNVNFVDDIPYKGIFDELYLKTFKEPKSSYNTFLVPLSVIMKIKYYGKYFVSFYDFTSNNYSHDPFAFSMRDMERYYSSLYKGNLLWGKSDKHYLISESDKFTNYIKIDLEKAKELESNRKIKYSFVDKFIKEKYNSDYSIISFGDISKIYITKGKIITVDFVSENIIKEDNAMSVDKLLERIKKAVSLSSVKYYSFHKDKIYVYLQNDEKEMLVLANINAKIMNTYQILKEKGLRKIIDFKQFSEVKVKRTQYPSLEEEYTPGYYDAVAYNHDFQLMYRIYDDGNYELISKQILIATAIEKSERYLKNQRFVKLPIFMKEKSKFNASDNSWILYFSGRDVEYTLKVYADGDEIKVQTLNVRTSSNRIEYLCKKLLGLKVENVSSRKHIFSGDEIWVVKYRTSDDTLKTMKLTSEDDILNYYKKEKE